MSVAATVKYRNVCFTYNSPKYTPEEYLARIQSSLPVAYCVLQHERGANGNDHYQGYLELSKQTRSDKVHEVLDRAHCESRKGSAKEAADYCKKVESRVAGPWEIGTISKQGKRSDIQAAVEEVQRGGILGVANNMPEAYVRYRSGLSSYHSFMLRHEPREPPTCRLYVGPSGVGKSSACWQRAPQLVAIPDTAWWDNYMGDDTILLDDFDGRRSSTKLRDLLQYLDRYPLRLPIKGGFVAAAWKEVLITTNFHPRDWYDWSEREVQYAALKRRVQYVRHWLTKDRYVELTPGHPDWDRYWIGPQPVERYPLGPMDDYVVHPEPKDYYNFYDPTQDLEASEEIV